MAQDLLLSGKVMRLLVAARRFHREVAGCSQQIFIERFVGQILRPWSRRIGLIDDLLRHLGLALDGQAAAGFARRPMLVVANGMLLRLMRRRPRPLAEPPTVIGIDDWA